MYVRSKGKHREILKLLKYLNKRLKPTYLPGRKILEVAELHFRMPLKCQKLSEACELCSVAPTTKFVMSRLDDRYVFQISGTLKNIVVGELIYCVIIHS
jgi:hypothetical protein